MPLEKLVLGLKGITWLPEKDHPVWKLAQSLVALAALAIWAYHGEWGPPTPIQEAGTHTPDMIGLMGSGVAAKLAWQFFRS